MTEKERLLSTLFDNSEKKLLNLKFFRMEGEKPVSEEAFCACVNKTLFEIDAGLADSVATFDRDTLKTVEVKTIAKRFAAA